MATILFVDTNLFLQCKDLTQIDWSDLEINETIILMLSSTVQEEIDLLKNDGNSRRAKKARKANTFLREIILSNKEEKIIREHPFKVVLKFSPIQSEEDRKKRHPDLNLERADNKILQEALNYQEQSSDTVAILTHDTNPLLTARRIKLNSRAIPDTWLLDPENSEQSKKIKSLEDRISILEKNTPKIIISCTQQNNPITELIVNIERPEKLTGDQINHIINRLKHNHPLLGREDILKKIEEENRWPFLNINSRYTPPTDNEIEAYINEYYPNWISSVTTYLENYHLQKIENTNITVYISLNNTGNVPAESVYIEFSVPSKLKLLTEDYEIKNINDAPLPKPPKAPTGERRDLLGQAIFQQDWGFSQVEKSRTTLLPELLRKNRDKNTFYWKSIKPEDPVEKFEFECAEFRHQLEPEVFKIILSIPDDQDLENSIFKTRISGKNIAEPEILNIPIKIQHVKTDKSKDILKKLIKA